MLGKGLDSPFDYRMLRETHHIFVDIYKSFIKYGMKDYYGLDPRIFFISCLLCQILSFSGKKNPRDRGWDYYRNKMAYLHLYVLSDEVI